MDDDETTFVRDPAPARTMLHLSSRYEHQGLLGEGAFGQVHRVLDRRLGRVVAMKVLRPEHARSELEVARFMSEAQAAAQLQHPNIVPVHDLDHLPDGRPYFTMREIDGRTLWVELQAAHRRLDPRAPLPTLRPLVDALRRVADAVGYAHRRGVIHRDLKPGNVVLEGDGALWVVDWGLAKVVGDGPIELTRRPSLRTMTGALVGTPHYMPPEQAEGRVTELDARVDVYALGGMLYATLVGKPPYHGKAGMAAVVEVLSGPPAPVASLAPWAPAALVAVCERAMARERDRRYASAVDFSEALSRWLEAG